MREAAATQRLRALGIRVENSISHSHQYSGSSGRVASPSIERAERQNARARPGSEHGDIVEGLHGEDGDEGQKGDDERRGDRVDRRVEERTSPAGREAAPQEGAGEADGEPVKGRIDQGQDAEDQEKSADARPCVRRREKPGAGASGEGRGNKEQQEKDASAARFDAPNGNRCDGDDDNGSESSANDGASDCASDSERASAAESDSESDSADDSEKGCDNKSAFDSAGDSERESENDSDSDNDSDSGSGSGSGSASASASESADPKKELRKQAFRLYRAPSLINCSRKRQPKSQAPETAERIAGRRFPKAEHPFCEANMPRPNPSAGYCGDRIDQRQ